MDHLSGKATNGLLLPIKRLRGRLRSARFSLGFSAGVVALAVMVAAQGAFPSGIWFITFSSFIVVGLVIGLLMLDAFDAVESAFFVGLLGFLVGTLVFAGGSSAARDLPWDSIVGETLLGALVGAVFGLVTGVVAAGGAAVGSLVRRGYSSARTSV